MDSPLAYDQKVKKEFGIDDDFEQEPALRVGFVRTQYEEIKKFLQRERIDLLLSEVQANSEIEAIAASARNKVAEHRNNIKGIVMSLTLLKKLLNELEGKK